LSDVHVASLHLYPIKGCRGIDLAAARVDVTGLASTGAGDREWMLIGEDGRFLTQRELPRLALVAVQLHGDRLRLAAPHMPPCDVPMAASGAARDVVVWRSEVRGIDQGDAAASWLSDWLAAPARLVRFDRSVTRFCNRDYAGSTGAHTLFADGYPILVATTASLSDLNERLAERGQPALPMNRFRPNVVLSGLPAFAEDHVDTITVGGIALKCVKPCTRCKVTTTDQATARVGIEPLRTLGEFRMDTRLDGVTFGMNAVVTGGAAGTIEVGAEATVEYRF
jgi:uncharacterized protein YcbX